MSVEFETVENSGTPSFQTQKNSASGTGRPSVVHNIITYTIAKAGENDLGGIGLSSQTRNVPLFQTSTRRKRTRILFALRARIVYAVVRTRRVWDGGGRFKYRRVGKGKKF